MRSVLILAALVSSGSLRAAELTPAQIEDGALRKAAFCVTKKARREVVQLMLSEPGSGQEQAAFVALDPTVSGCKIALPTDEMSHARLRAGLARAIYMDHVLRINSMGQARSADEIPTNRGFPEAKGLQADYRMAMCIYAVSQDRGVDSLIRTTPGSPAEKAAIEALVPRLTSCVDKDQQFSLRPRTFRMTLETITGYINGPLFKAMIDMKVGSGTISYRP